MSKNYDFSGWATRNNIRCSDGRTIRRDAFKDNDGQTVPLVWNHNHNDPFNVLGHALLKNRPEGVYAYCTLNDSAQGKNARELVEHGDVDSLSIYANNLRQNGGDVMHGKIREVSLVLAGANPGAYIDSVIVHGDDSDDKDDLEAIIYSGSDLELSHADTNKNAEDDKENGSDDNTENKETKMAKNQQPNTNGSGNEETVEDVFNTLTDKQKQVVYALIGMAIEDAKNGDLDDKEKSEPEDEEDMKHNVFDIDNQADDVISHAEQMDIIADGKRYGSLRDSALAHGIDNINYLFPDAKTIENAPSFVKRQDEWVSDFMNNTHHTPFSRIKSIYANITEDDARARGYIKGKLKKEEVFALLRRTTNPTTIYKKQKLDRDDIVDITGFDVVAWLKTEMRQMLNEEIARACLIGDGRLASSEDKISETNIRPIATDSEFYTIKAGVNYNQSATQDDIAKQFIRSALMARKYYKGSGNPTLYTTEDMLTACLLLEDKMGRVIYDSVDKLATTMRVSKIVTVPSIENEVKTSGDVQSSLYGIIVNPIDYNIGADSGGAVNMFDDFDIDYNQQKYLIETRCSGALVNPFSAIAVWGSTDTVTDSNNPTEPTAEVTSPFSGGVLQQSTAESLLA